MNYVRFVEDDISTTQKRMVENFEIIRGRKLYDGDPIKIIINAFASEISLLNSNINYSANQNILSNVSEENINNIGELLGVTRLTAGYAYTILEFTTTKIMNTKIKIPKGTRVCDKTQNVYFETTDDCYIEKNSDKTTVNAKCQTIGTIGNDIAIGELTELVDIFTYFKSVENITISNSGADVEDVESYRNRIKNAPEKLSTAGSENAYIHKVLELTPLITDVSVTSNDPGVVEIIPLTKDIIPSDELIEEIHNFITRSDVRPLTDYVIVSKPNITNFNIDIVYYTSDGQYLEKEVNEKIELYKNWQSQKLGRDINPSKLLAFIMEIEDIKRVEVKEPKFTVIQKTSVGICIDSKVIDGGFEDE